MFVHLFNEYLAMTVCQALGQTLEIKKLRFCLQEVPSLVRSVTWQQFQCLMVLEWAFERVHFSENIFIHGNVKNFILNVYQKCFILHCHDLIYTSSSIIERGSCKNYPVLVYFTFELSY